MRSAREERRRAHEHPGRAVAALERVVLVERLLERGELAVPRETLDGGDAHTFRLDGQQHAALHGLAVQVHRAGTAVPRVAADMRPGEAEVVAEEVDEEPARRNLVLDLLAVDLDRHGLARHGPHYFLLPAACSTARTADTSATCRLKSAEPWTSAGGSSDAPRPAAAARTDSSEWSPPASRSS